MHLRHVFRRLRREPGFTAAALITLAVGIGANTAIFSVVHGVVLKPLPYREPDRLIAVWQTAPGVNIKDLNVSPASYLTYREESRTFEDIAMWRGGSSSVTGKGEPEQVDTLVVTDGFFGILGVEPSAGRRFNRQDDSPGTPETVMLSYGYWQRKFGGEASAIGRRIVVDGSAREIIGVLPQKFRFMSLNPSLILPFRINRQQVFIGNFSYLAVARLKRGVSLEQANADIARMLPMMAGRFPPPPGMSFSMLENTRMGPNARPLKQDVIGNIADVLWVLMGTVGIVLFIACANVANLLLVRAEGRQQELAVRAALGAGWSRIARELLTESVMLGLLGGALAAGLAYAGLRLLVSIGPGRLPRLDEISIDPTVLLFTIAISLAAGFLFGLVPVVKYAGPHLISALGEGGRTVSAGRERRRARSVLVVVQVSLALVLLVSSGLMIRSFVALRNVEPGFVRPDEVLTLRISLPPAQVADPEQVARLQHEMLGRIAAVPGVVSAALGNSVTMDGSRTNDPIYPQDHPVAEGVLPPIRRYKFVTPGYFHTLGNPLLAGRDFTWQDIFDKRPTVLVSENLAREYWGSPGSALGKRVRENLKGEWREIIGVVGNERDNGVDQKAPAIVYFPMMTANLWSERIAVRRGVALAIRSSRAGSEGFLNEVRQAIWSVRPDVPVAAVRTLREIHDRSMARTSFTLVMLAIAAGMALLLGVIGIYGVIAYSVSQRTREIGIRMALGAPDEAIRRMFVRHGFTLVAIGVGCGFAAAAALSRVMTSLLFEVRPLDPVTYVAVAAILATAALLASYLPARRATGVDPVETLRMQ